MKEKFFEGGDYPDQEFKALQPEYYPPEYQEYIREETQLLKEIIEGSNRVLEAGVGIGRLIPELAPRVKELVGVDNAELMLDQSRLVAKDYENVQIQEAELERVSELFPRNHFEHTICVWNTLGNVKDEEQILKELSAVTSGSIIITVYLKGTIEQRRQWYASVGVELEHVDEDKEIFYTRSGLQSKSYSLVEIEELAEKTGLQVARAKELNGVMLWAELEKATGSR